MSATVLQSSVALPAVPDVLLDTLAVRRLLRSDNTKVVVLDDDPTGTQTVHGVDVLTEWTIPALVGMLANPETCCFILTNTRARPEVEACGVVQEIVRNLASAATESGRRFCLVSRSDSTLRGHFPAEIEAIRTAGAGAWDALFLIPAFLKAGRCTVEGIHYVRDAAGWHPVGETEYAQDASFGYRASHLAEWVEEKSGGRIPAHAVQILSLKTIRQGGAPAVRQFLAELSPAAVVAVDAEDPADFEIIVHALLQAEQAGRRFLYRTAADFVRARAGIVPQGAPVLPELASAGAQPGLIVVGSYVQRSTEQLQRAKTLPGVEWIEVGVEQVLDPRAGRAELARVAARADAAIAAGRHALVATSRELVNTVGRAGELHVAQRISQSLVEIVERMRHRPGFLVAKGGITSSDLAVKALGVRRARVLGQLLPGIAVWRLGTESRFPGLAYVVFPGNVGEADTLADLIRLLTRRVTSGQLPSV